MPPPRDTATYIDFYVSIGFHVTFLKQQANLAKLGWNAQGQGYEEFHGIVHGP